MQNTKGPLTFGIISNPSMQAYAVEIISSNPSCASHTDVNGDTPLHWCASMNSPPKIIEALLRSYPEGVYKRNHSGRTPVEEFFGVDNNQIGANSVGETSLEEISFRYQGLLSNETVQVSETEENALISNACMILYVLENGYLPSQSIQDEDNCFALHTQKNENDGEPTFFAIHSSLEEKRCPILFSHLLLNKLPHHTWMRNKYGKLPLELALSNNKHSNMVELASFLQSLLQSNPEGASIPDATHTRLPLAKCAMQGMDVRDDASPARIILKSAPRALVTPDYTTHMLPFMLVAARIHNKKCKQTTNNSCSSNEDKKRTKAEEKLGLTNKHSQQKRKMKRSENLSTLYNWIMLDPTALLNKHDK